MSEQQDDLNVLIKNEGIDFILQAQNRGERATVLLCQDDGTLREWGLQVYRNAVGSDRVALVEDDGTVRQQIVLWNYTGGAQIRAAGEPATGEARTIPCGKDEALNVDEFRTDPDRIPWKRDYPAYVQVDPAVLANADGMLWNPGAVAAQLYEVSFLLVNIAGAASGPIDVGVDIAAGGALGGAEFWVRQEVLPDPGTSGWRGPFVIAGYDDVRGWCAGAANQVCIHFRIRRVDIGA